MLNFTLNDWVFLNFMFFVLLEYCHKRFAISIIYDLVDLDFHENIERQANSRRCRITFELSHTMQFVSFYYLEYDPQAKIMKLTSLHLFGLTRIVEIYLILCWLLII